MNAHLDINRLHMAETIACHLLRSGIGGWDPKHIIGEAAADCQNRQAKAIARVAYDVADALIEEERSRVKKTEGTA